MQEQLRRNAVIRRCRSNANAPSLLAGLLVDEDGNRMSPSHANKSGRRYRYYVSRTPTTSSPDAVDGWRLPARAIEEAVLNGVCTLLRDKLRLIDALSLTGRRLKMMLSKASQLGNRTLEAGPAEQREFLLEVVDHIEVRRNRIRIILRANSLRGMIGKGESEKEYEENGAQNKGEIKLDLPVRFKRRGVEMKLVIVDDRNPGPTPDAKLIAAIAQGRTWFDQFKNGDARSAGDLAQRHGVDQGDVAG